MDPEYEAAMRADPPDLERRVPPHLSTEYLEGLERALRAVLLFHRGGEWTEERQADWYGLTGHHEATTANLCDTARRALGIDDITRAFGKGEG